jgi:carbonic anhydrase
MTIEKINQQSKIITDLIAAKKITMVGGIYDVDTGRVDFFDN